MSDVDPMTALSVEPGRPGELLEEPGPEWRALGFELDSWATSGQVATMWWRDDDATDACPPLRRLRALSDAVDVPVALSVVPAVATQELAAFIADWPQAVVLQHGYEHVNYASVGDKKTELANGRPIATMLADVERGAETMRRMFGDHSIPVLVPPWNRISPALVTALPKLGLTGLSAFRGRKVAPPEVVEVNVHVDVVNWRGRVFVGERMALEAVINHLRSRRLGSDDPNEPTGLLTHHQVLDEAAWSFLDKFLTVTRAHRAVRWLDARSVFTRPA